MALAAVAPTPVRSRQMERIVIGNRLDHAIIEKAVGESCTDACSITDVSPWTPTCSMRRPGAAWRGNPEAPPMAHGGSVLEQPASTLDDSTIR